MSRRILYKFICCVLAVTCCFVPLVYAGGSGASPQLYHEITKTKQDDDKVLIEKKTVFMLPAEAYLGNFKFERKWGGFANSS